MRRKKVQTKGAVSAAAVVHGQGQSSLDVEGSSVGSCERALLILVPPGALLKYSRHVDNMLVCKIA